MLIFLILSSCEDIVDIELEDFPESLVVDAWINDLPEDQIIVLSQTNNYFENVSTPKISDARVSVMRNNDTELVFESQGEGRYVYSGDIGNIGDTYELNIEFDGKQYCANSEMKRVPTVDSIDVEFLEDEFIIDDGLYTEFFARDFEGFGDAYWIKTFKNSVFRDNPRELRVQA